jgi:hypothetical protein
MKVWIVCLLALFASSAQAEQPAKYDIVLMIGQSNMTGQGKIEPQDLEPIKGAFKLNSHFVWAPAKDPTNHDGPRAIGVGPGRSFAKELLRARPAARIGLVNAAVGGTTLQQWSPGGSIYNRALLFLRKAKRSGKLVAILWHQGESDAGNPRRAEAYAQKWVAMMTQLRRDARAENVPIIAGEIGTFLDKPYARKINAQIKSLPSRMSNVAVVSSAGLKQKGDGLHFDAASERELGRRYARAFLELVPSWSRTPSE